MRLRNTVLSVIKQTSRIMRFARHRSKLKTVRRWDAECLRTLKGHDDAVFSAAFAPTARCRPTPALKGFPGKFTLWSMKDLRGAKPEG